ncbi:hypothetical protein LG52_24 [Geobacillus kaustophilus]|uniref:Uncharacterized protein n=1 Tax=Geobacillus kaustophilus TaxID=1462 RepID=A0A0D8BPI4_GEOKU|nr:hypothetical protein [Geobacillus kaustophilus]KJE26123.1 hypothetical protein LG52_24 [Geobacillus kaustophilus]
MALKIAKGKVSEKDWSSVDKSSIWRRLKQALEDGEQGATEAVREMYAVVKANINADLTQADCWAPHHEIQGDTLVLNKNGLTAAVAALAGARSEPNLTAEQKRQAAKHLLRHYRELKMEAPESLLKMAGEKMSNSEEVTCLNEKLYYIGKFTETVVNEQDEDMLKMAELFSVGAHRGVEYTEQDLEELANNFDPSEEVPIQIDHSESAKDTVGYLESVEVKDGKLLGVLRIIDDFAKERIRKNLMKKLSISFYLKHTEEGFKPYKLREVSLVAFPQVKTARLFSENGYISTYEENKEVGKMADKEKAVNLSELRAEIRKEIEQEIHAEYAELTKRLEALEKVQQQFSESQVKAKIEAFQEENKIVPAQVDALEKLLKTFNEEQMGLFDEFMKNFQKVDLSEQGEVQQPEKEQEKDQAQDDFEKFYEEYVKKYGRTL